MKSQKGFIQIPLLIGIIVAVAILSGAGVGIVLHKQGKLFPLVTNISQVFKGTEEPIAAEIEETDQEELLEQTLVGQGPTESQTEQELEKTKEENRIRAEQQKLQNQQVQLPPPNSILCNGKYWSSCPDGQIFYCPSTTGNPQCIAENTQTYIDSLSGLQKMRDCMKSATERYQEAKALAEADEKKCKEEGHDPMICFIRGTAPSIASYYSSCLGVSRISENESKYYLPPSSYDLDKLQRQLDELERETEEQKRKFQKYQFDQSLNCTLSGGYYIGNICYPSFLK